MPLHQLYASELSALCASVKPFPLLKPEVVAINQPLIKKLGLQDLLPDEDALLHALFSTNGILQENSVAQKYGGHQFGQWNPHLGDGRGLLLAEVKTPEQTFMDLHLKGAGPTPFSRHADGRAVLRSSIREYLASEALHALNIPSSRALALIGSKEPIWRESLEQGAMLIRTCPSHIRFGHFEYFYHINDTEKLDALFEFCFSHHFKEAAISDNPYLALLTEICESTAKMIAKWQAYGFNHGVMNTDNMSIHGITFDFGPYAFLDDFIPNYICNKSDHSGRYAFNQQPSIGLWNLNALAHAFSQKLTIEEIKRALAQYEPTFLAHYKKEMLYRLGLDAVTPKLADSQLLDRPTNNDDSLALTNRFVKLLGDEFADYHLSFRRLSESFSDILAGKAQTFSQGFKQDQLMHAWCSDYAQSFINGQTNNAHADNSQPDLLPRNPKYVLRNHHMQYAIEQAEHEDFSVFNDLLSVINNPYEEHEHLHHLSLPPDEEDKGIALSCSS